MRLEAYIEPKRDEACKKVVSPVITPNKFKVGDHVKLVRSDYPLFGYYMGDVGTVISIHQQSHLIGTKYEWYVKLDSGTDLSVCEYCLELVESR